MSGERRNRFMRWFGWLLAPLLALTLFAVPRSAYACPS
jgi:hypothetical protein